MILGNRKPRSETRDQVDPRTLVATSVFAGEVGYLAVAQWLSSIASGHGAASGVPAMGAHTSPPRAGGEVKEDDSALRRRPAPASSLPAGAPSGGITSSNSAEGTGAAAAAGKKDGAGVNP